MQEENGKRWAVNTTRLQCETIILRDWSNGVGGSGAGLEQTGGGSSVFEPLVRGGLFTFQLPIGVGQPGGWGGGRVGDWDTFHTIDNKGNSFQIIIASGTL